MAAKEPAGAATIQRRRDERSRRVETLLDAGKWAEARRLLRSGLRREPDHHWLLTRIGTTYYE